MYIRKSVLGMMVAAGGAAVLAVLAVLFCFTEIRIPTAVYGAAWFGCLYAMLAATSRIYR
ncbi:hypothetical protein [Clostridium sp. Marseille-P3244]|uniref:hypothetical protein n=1 Tax=Clostridium sp. Marseille-P3244 TaxID=1871020 RepID=UPI000931A925|nr:hypothetical protein [Clostridium sp. Marseille-P3244]